MTGQAKVRAVKDYLRDLLEAEKKFICFAHHSVMMEAVAELLEKEKVDYVRIDGSTSSERRNVACEQFQVRTKSKETAITPLNALL